MDKSAKKVSFSFERTIPAEPDELFDAWLSPDTPGTPWNENDKLILNPVVDGFFYWLIRGTAHYGRFIDVSRPNRLEHTWMSRNTHGEESLVTVTFAKRGDDTLMTLVHANLPDSEPGRSHQAGWNYFLDHLVEHFGAIPRRR